jgi:FK506-binding nuclear protein
MESPKNLKRPRDDTMEVDDHEEKLSKSQKKKLAKKLKAADGEAVPAPELEKKVEEKKEEPKKEKKKKDKADKKEKPEQKDGEKKEKGDRKDQRTLDGGVKVWDSKVGTGKSAKKGDKVKMRYIGKLLDGKVFDKNTSGKPVGWICCVPRITHNAIA